MKQIGNVKNYAFPSKNDKNEGMRAMESSNVHPETRMNHLRIWINVKI